MHIHWLRRGGFPGEERTGYGSRPRIGNLVVPLLCQEVVGVEHRPKETGRRTLRRWVEQNASGLVLGADANTRGLDDETLDFCE